VLNLKLTSNATDLVKIYYTKVIDNLYTFLVSINTPIYNKWFRSNDL
jgi:hypothetical protein